jgi:hypothetical protein
MTLGQLLNSSSSATSLPSAEFISYRRGHIASCHNELHHQVCGLVRCRLAEGSINHAKGSVFPPEAHGLTELNREPWPRTWTNEPGQYMYYVHQPLVGTHSHIDRTIKGVVVDGSLTVNHSPCTSRMEVLVRGNSRRTRR